MEQPISGVKLYIHKNGEPWKLIDEYHLEEGSFYEWKLLNATSTNITFMNMPLSHYPISDGIQGNFTTPFQSGLATFQIDNETIQTYIYPDNRKMTEQQFERMLMDVLEEAVICFQYSGLSKSFSTSGRTRRLSWAQWNYIIRSINTLFQLMNKLKERPLRKLVKNERFVKRENVTTLTIKMEKWLEQNVGRNSQDTIPRVILDTKAEDTVDLYENKVIKRQLFELIRLLNIYIEEGEGDIPQKAEYFKERISYFIKHSFLKNVSEHKGTIAISQVFRKHPIYRQWYNWFTSLYNHQNYNIGFETQLSLLDTFQLYEYWCFMNTVKVFRKKGLLEDTSQLFNVTNEGISLLLAENHESKVRLKGEMSLYYQRVYQYNTRPLYSYTQRMIPDIVLQKGDKLFIFDPKYRVPNNLQMALGEMHKYRDGILHAQTNEKVVEAVFIMTPTKTNFEELRFFNKDFHEKYKMGAIRMLPGDGVCEIEECLSFLGLI